MLWQLKQKQDICLHTIAIITMSRETGARNGDKNTGDMRRQPNWKIYRSLR